MYSRCRFGLRRPSYVSRPFPSSVASATVPENPVRCDRYEALIASGPCASSMSSAAVPESSANPGDDDSCIFDELVIRTFTIRKIHSFVEKTYDSLLISRLFILRLFLLLKSDG